jgi:hypothetical protein
MDGRAASCRTLAATPGIQLRRPSSSLPPGECVNAHHERPGAADQVTNLDRLGDTGFPGRPGGPNWICTSNPLPGQGAAPALRGKHY